MYYLCIIRNVYIKLEKTLPNILFCLILDCQFVTIIVVRSRRVRYCVFIWRPSSHDGVLHTIHMFISFSYDANLTKLITFNGCTREIVHRNLLRLLCLVKVGNVEQLGLELNFGSCILAHSCTLEFVAIALAGAWEPFRRADYLFCLMLSGSSSQYS